MPLSACCSWCLGSFFLSFLAALYSCLGTSCVLTPAGKQPQCLNTSECRSVRPRACVGLLPLSDSLRFASRATLLLLLGEFPGFSLEEAHLEKQEDTDEMPHQPGALQLDAAVMPLCDVTESTGAYRRPLTKSSGKDRGRPRPTGLCLTGSGCSS